MIQGWYCKEKVDASHRQKFKIVIILFLVMCFNPVMLKIWSVLQFSFVETYTVLYISFNFNEGIW